MLIFFKIAMDGVDPAKLPRVILQNHSTFYNLPEEMKPFLVGIEDKMAASLEGFGAKLWLPIDSREIQRIKGWVRAIFER